MHKRLRDLKKRVEAEGLEVVAVTVAGSGHYKMRLRANGMEKVAVCAYSPSDHRAGKNWMAQVRRMFALH